MDEHGEPGTGGADAVVAELARAGWAVEDARRRLAELGWDRLLPAADGEVRPEVVAADVRRHTRCEICGHPLHQVSGDVALPVADGTRLARRLPYTAACSCGYARPLIPHVWTAVIQAYFRRHPQARTVDAGAPGFLEAATGPAPRR